jgi:oligoendopeptidase F
MQKGLLKDLPTWDLSDLYQGLADPNIDNDLDTINKLSDLFCKTYHGKFVDDNFSGELLFQAIVDYEKIFSTLGKLTSFSGLSYYADLNNSLIQQLYQKIEEKNAEISSKLIFFTLDINKISDTALQKSFENNKNLVKYKAWLDNVRVMKNYQLSNDLEKIFIEKSVTSTNAWIKLYDELTAKIEFDYNGQKLPLAAIVDNLSDKDEKVRKDSAFAFSEGLNKNLDVITKITNILIKDKEIEDSWRKMPNPMFSRHLSNQIEPEVVDCLLNTVKDNYKNLSHRYYKIKASILGLEKIEYWDRNAPISNSSEKQFSWLESQKIVFDAYNEFSPILALNLKKFFDNNWIDVPIRSSKTSGAFSHPCVPEVHPYILLNFRGKLRDVMTLAHELGHGVHQILSAQQGYLLSDTPLTLAETASVFGEMLTFQSLLKKTTTNLEKRSLLCAKIEDMLNTVVRQIAFYDFEIQIHNLRKQGEISIDKLNQIWLSTQKEALGDFVNLDPVVSCFWGYISHFIHSPFYVYAYAFGDCLVNSLYSLYKKQPEGFVEKYIELLKAGGSKNYVELLKPFGLNPKDKTFWQNGLNTIIELIDMLEEN